jgi:hypothetical protein
MSHHARLGACAALALELGRDARRRGAASICDVRTSATPGAVVEVRSEQAHTARG